MNANQRPSLKNKICLMRSDEIGKFFLSIIADVNTEETGSKF